LKAFVSGSDTSWLSEHLYKSKGGLYNRVTRSIKLLPFTLNETESFFNSKKFDYNRLSVLQIYMIFHGKSYYLNMFDNSLSASQNINKLYFGETAPLKREYERLLDTLESSSSNYEIILQSLNTQKIGLSKVDLLQICKIKDEIELTKYLEDLEMCGLIGKYTQVLTNNKLELFYISDLFILFHLKFRDKQPISDYWINCLNTPILNSWYGLTFEKVAYAHIANIKEALGIRGVSTNQSPWYGEDEEMGKCQIYLLIERADNIINIIEIKYSEQLFALSNDEYDKFLIGRDIIRKLANVDSGFEYTILTTKGITNRTRFPDVSVELNLDDLF
jgi:hypothetical protein